MDFLTFDETKSALTGRRIAVVGSGPSVLMNDTGQIDDYDVVVRVNNYKLSSPTGKRTDVHYSFYGTSITKTAKELKNDGVSLCMCKCPNSSPIKSDWHVRMGKVYGIDFRYIYKMRSSFWFCPTYVPTDEEFNLKMLMLDNHIPTTGFSAILDLLKCAPSELYITGFDFFSSGVHNVDEKWKPGNLADPIGHSPEREYGWLKHNASRHPIVFDGHLKKLMKQPALKI